MAHEGWKHGIFGIPSIMGIFMASEMFMALVLLINYCIWFFFVKGAPLPPDTITEQELKDI